MGISPECSAIAALRAQAASEGVSPTDEDLEAVGSFLEIVLPPLRELEERIPPEIAP